MITFSDLLLLTKKILVGIVVGLVPITIFLISLFAIQKLLQQTNEDSTRNISAHFQKCSHQFVHLRAAVYINVSHIFIKRTKTVD